jgi:hypothetical protein
MSPNPVERKAYKIVRRRYENAEARFQKAVSAMKMTTRDLVRWGIQP